MAFIDYYKILGVAKDIPQKDVKKAYLKRAKLFHPDLHPDDPKAKAKFQALNEAYEVIGDPEKRQKYDRYGEHWREAEQFGGGGGGQRWSSAGGSPFEGFDFSNFSSSGGGFSSFFQDLFGGTRRRGGASTVNASGNVNASVNIPLGTALLGGDVVIQLNNGSKLKLKVKPGTQPGAKVRLRGKGNSRPDGTSGDLIVTFNVQLPTQLSEHQQQLIREAGI